MLYISLSLCLMTPCTKSHSKDLSPQTLQGSYVPERLNLSTGTIWGLSGGSGSAPKSESLLLLFSIWYLWDRLITLLLRQRDTDRAGEPFGAIYSSSEATGGTRTWWHHTVNSVWHLLCAWFVQIHWRTLTVHIKWCVVSTEWVESNEIKCANH